ncbi:MAG: hypothetical protein ACLFUS_16695 [Candidatus Sumerlaeia bacterium]
MKSHHCRIVGIFVLLLGLAGLVACQAARIQDAKYGPVQSQKRLLLLGEKSEFKAKMIETLVQDLSDKGWYVKVSDYREADPMLVGKFDQTLLVNSCWAWKLNPKSRKFLESVQEKDRDKIIHMTTTADPDSKVKTYGLDGITGSSKVLDPVKTAEKLAAMIEKRQ